MNRYVFWSRVITEDIDFSLDGSGSAHETRNLLWGWNVGLRIFLALTASRSAIPAVAEALLLTLKQQHTGPS